MNRKLLCEKHFSKEQCSTNLSWRSNQNKEVSKTLIFWSQLYMHWDSIIYNEEMVSSDFFISWRPWLVFLFNYNWKGEHFFLASSMTRTVPWFIWLMPWPVQILYILKIWNCHANKFHCCPMSPWTWRDLVSLIAWLRFL